MGPDERMLILDRLSSDNTTSVPAKLRLLKSRMYSLQAMQSLLERFREAVVRLDLISKQGVTANFRRVENGQKGHSRWLGLVRDIRMPAYSTGAVGKERVDLAARWAIAMNDVELRETLGTSAGGVDVVATEIGTKVELFLSGEVGQVLVTEGYDFALSNEQGELVFPRSGELAQLDAGHFGSDAWRELLDLAAF